MKHLNYIFQGVLKNPVLEEEFAAAFPKKYRPGGANKSLCPWHKGRKPTLEFINGTHCVCSKCTRSRTFDRVDLQMLLTGRGFYDALMDLGERDDLVLQRGGVCNPTPNQSDEYVVVRRAIARKPLEGTDDKAA
jgi:hypothetical protein